MLMAFPLYVYSVFEFSLHPQAVIVEKAVYTAPQYIVALDKYRKIDNRWVPEQFQRQSGELQRYTIEMPRNYTEKDALTYFKDQLPKSAERLFACDGRACGESNNWANDHFGIKQLYGTNVSQIYRTYRMAESNSISNVTYVTLYVVRRGNRRLYVQLDTLYSR